MRTERYDSPGAVEAAIREAARKAHRVDPSLTVFDRIRQEHFNRFLSRVFSEAEGSGWMLKGGTSILARVPAARSTTDVDLFRRSRSLDEALADLRRLAAIDLGDFFQFGYTGHTNSVAGDMQTYAEGYKVNFDIYIGAKKMNSFHVDAEAKGRGLTLSQTFDIPSRWGAGYRTLAEAVSTCEPYRTIDAAKALVQRFIEPVLNGGADGKTWDRSRLDWL